MRTLHGHREARALLDAHRAAGRTVGMVGTSGAIHEGHLSLVERARRENDVVALFYAGVVRLDWTPVSAQVYERDIERDKELLAAAGVDLFLVMRRDDLYARRPVTFLAQSELVPDVPGLLGHDHASILATMVISMLNIAGPCTNYSGEKDWQQLVLFRRAAQDLLLPSTVVGCPTVREPDGVARSSRNVRLTASQRAAAPVIYRALTEAARLVHAGERDARAVTSLVADRVGGVAAVDYVHAVEADTLRPLDHLAGDVRLLVSATFGDTPLVDNIGVTVPAQTGRVGAADGGASTGNDTTKGVE
ncbi:pantoate--beta-alanine ligase [Frankia sp. CNm7]|uniref:Pantothenate synthetase n=1 Tax=Frankia nepalensis TaxID=1836974 RepID=A0A937UN72_9ACTN|nr:pantoate--beta-alanine ligase [Frankia nepalensis]MBL7496303.1 pantoate--beta-alanine ligase [Frankia nepalensis]MBL7508500.1 pantoate--beta-alanine ligase [Frankia nepalensis]MBL7520233.1 pantoate--beta-alanine ligase [Frankia nepalensis]MBL7627632.1 pantoate--beta-alanine ligase [Frankia nepalensis]